MYNADKNLLDDFSEQLEGRILPSGSGINSDWDISYSNDARTVSCSNVYDHMNEAGFYDAAIPFKVDIPIENPLGFDLSITGDDVARAFAEEDELGSYLEDTMAYALDEHTKDFQDFAKEVNKRDIDIKEDVLFEGMKILSENRTRPEKETSAIRSYLEKAFKATDKTSEPFLYEINENRINISKELHIAPPIHNWVDFEYAGHLTQDIARVDMPENPHRLLEKIVSVERNEYGYACVRYGAGRNDLSSLTKSKFFADGKLIGEAQYREGDELKPAKKYTIYGLGPVQRVLKKEIDRMNDFATTYGNPVVPITVEPESRERFPGTERLIDDFKKSGGKEISYTQSKEAGIGC